MVEYLVDGNARQAALRAGIPETYAARQGAWLKKHPIVKQVLEKDLDESDIKKLKRELAAIHQHIENCKNILALEL